MSGYVRDDFGNWGITPGPENPMQLKPSAPRTWPRGRLPELDPERGFFFPGKRPGSFGYHNTAHQAVLFSTNRFHAHDFPVVILRSEDD